MINIYVIVRLLIGGLLVFASTQKLFSPYQNFLFIIHSYGLFSFPIDYVIAWILPWIELFLGIFLIFGLWLKHTLRGTLILFFGFIVVLAQALIRKLPVNDCGCFGDGFSLPLPWILSVDSLLLLMLVLLLWKIKMTSHVSLDEYFEKHG